MMKFYKGRTTNHLTWVMVDSTDFATPESALSAATKIKVYGKLRADDTVRLVSSGTGSLANDIKHVGASVLGIYTIGLTKPDLSDASAAWYDQYIVSLSATGAAYQVLVVDGGIDDSALSDLISNAYSAAAQANSRVLVVQSMVSDVQSAVAIAPTPSDVASAVAIQIGSLLSDILSAAQQTNSRALVGQSYLSDIRSHVSDLQSDFQSRVPKRVATDSQLSDLASDVRSMVVLVQSLASDAHSAAAQANSRVLVVQSMTSDLQSKISDVESNLLSVLGTTGVQLNASSLSDIRSAITAGATGLDASALSDIASAVVAALGATGVEIGASSMSDIRSAILVVQSMASDAHSAAAQTNSRVLLNQSRISDIYSLLSDLHSDVGVMSGVVSDLSSGVNVTEINGTTLTGNGTTIPWGPA